MYSCTTTGSSLNDLWEQAKEMGLEGLDFTVIDRWHDNTFFHNAIAQNIVQAIKNIQENDAENNTNTLQKTAILFSAHSIPLKVMNKGDQYPAEISHTVEQTMVKLNQIVKQENTQNNQNNSTAQFGPKSLPILPHQLCWQSKVGFLPWLQPSTSTAIEKLKTLGFTQAIIVPVAFTSDHIETLHEIDIEYQELAHKSGIKLIRAESLNNSMFLTKAQADIVKTHMDNNEIVRSHQYRIKCHECVQPDVCRTVLGYNEDQLFLNKRIPKA
jgi:ferrochelatase